MERKLESALSHLAPGAIIRRIREGTSMWSLGGMNRGEYSNSEEGEGLARKPVPPLGLKGGGKAQKVEYRTLCQARGGISAEW